MLEDHRKVGEHSRSGGAVPVISALEWVGLGTKILISANTEETNEWEWLLQRPRLLESDELKPFPAKLYFSNSKNNSRAPFLLASIPGPLPRFLVEGLAFVRRLISLVLLVLTLQYIFVCWCVTNGSQCPTKLQIEASLAAWSKRDVFVVAGIGTGKTLAGMLNQLLEPATGITLVISPLKRLQTSQLDLEDVYALEPLIVNEDTSRELEFWNVLCILQCLYREIGAESALTKSGGGGRTQPGYNS
ncbi:hypothetical protein C8J56DRAFT_1166823 [Mycena floridula]|nr:hypothetical protein C8J56DRAFT_1166823 [Mycena floridula]